MGPDVDPFISGGLPPRSQWPDFRFTRAELHYPDRLNAATELLDRSIARGWGTRPCLITDAGVWTYAQLLQNANRLANLLVHNHGIKPGNRVLIRAWNSPWAVGWWFACLKIGAVVVTTSPQLKKKELCDVLDACVPQLAVVEEDLTEELEAAGPRPGMEVFRWGDPNSRVERQPDTFTNFDSASDDVCLIGLTSGTTGKPKCPCHFHRAVLAIADSFSAYVLKPRGDDVFCGTPSLSFTYGLGALLVFPMRVGASAVLFKWGGPEALAAAIERHSATICFTAPKGYLELSNRNDVDLSSLRHAVSGGEHLPAATSEAFDAATGIKITNGIGSTEMLHNFISSRGTELPAGATGRAVPGYQVRVVDKEGRDVSLGESGMLAVRGPTGCLYLRDERQRTYVRDGWNYTGDTFTRDEEDVFWYQGRTDDMIVASGYNVSPVEVEDVLLEHPLVADCGVTGALRGDTSVVKAWVVLTRAPRTDPTSELKEFVKARLAVYKSPREIEYVTALPRTANGKLRRAALNSQTDFPRL